MTVTIWHNPACGTSRNVLAMIRASISRAFSPPERLPTGARTCASSNRKSLR